MQTRKITVILVCWKRFDNFNQIIRRWYTEPEVDEIIVWDNSGSFKTHLPVHVINSNINTNPSVRYAIASMAKNDIIIHCDDDVMPQPGLAKEMLQGYNKDALVGVEGVNFKGDSYYHQSRVYGKSLSEVVSVDMVIGFLTITHKKNFAGFDYSKFTKYQLEMNLQALSPDLKRLVAPATKFLELSCGKDANALHLNPNGRADKERLYRAYFS